jgi:hypothetical protein
MVNYLLAFDPGITTGWSFWNNGVFQASGDLLGEKVLIDHILKYKDLRPLTVIYEGFARGNTAVVDQLRTIECCGLIKAICIEYQIPYAIQFPAERKGFIPFAKRILEIEDSKYHHSIDATAHVLKYYHKHNRVLFNDILKRYHLENLL